MLLIKTVTSVLKVLTYIITNITDCPVRLAAIQVIIAFLTFITAVILYINLRTFQTYRNTVVIFSSTYLYRVELNACTLSYILNIDKKNSQVTDQCSILQVNYLLLGNHNNSQHPHAFNKTISNKFFLKFSTRQNTTHVPKTWFYRSTNNPHDTMKYIFCTCSGYHPRGNACNLKMHLILYKVRKGNIKWIKIHYTDNKY
jgi:hypothetical protein